jgi:RNA polymerase sigma-70 factor (ECF subfamily)
VEDVVQDVFIEAARGLHQLQEPDALKGWLAAVTVRVCGRRLRVRRLRRWAHLDATPDYLKLEAPGASAEQRILLAEIYRALDDLPVAERIAWTLRYLEDEPLEAIAARCGCSLATVKRRIVAAHERVTKVVGR